MAYEIIWEDGGVLVVCSGPFMMEELNKANGLIQGHKNFDFLTYQVWDLLDADMTDIDKDQMIEPAAIDNIAERTNNRIKVALVAREDHSKELCEVYKEHLKEFGSTWDCRIYDSVSEARDWTNKA